MNYLHNFFSNQIPGDPQHLLMANSLKEWHNDPSVSSIEYTRMAWSGGMRMSEAFDQINCN